MRLQIWLKRQFDIPEGMTTHKPTTHNTSNIPCLITVLQICSDSMVHPKVDRDWFRNVSNLVPVKLNLIRDSIYACIRLLFANFLMLKISHTCIYLSTT